MQKLTILLKLVVIPKQTVRRFVGKTSPTQHVTSANVAVVENLSSQNNIGWKRGKIVLVEFEIAQDRIIRVKVIVCTG